MTLWQTMFGYCDEGCSLQLRATSQLSAFATLWARGVQNALGEILVWEPAMSFTLALYVSLAVARPVREPQPSHPEQAGPVVVMRWTKFMVTSRFASQHYLTWHL